MRELAEYIYSISHLSSKTCLEKARGWTKERGIGMVPVGEANSKTQVFSVYRKVGDTCPSTCPYLNRENEGASFCYACQGNVAMAARRASNDTGDFIRAVVVASVMSIVKHGSPCRINVSGDIARNGVLDEDLVGKLCEAAMIVRDVLGYSGVVAYGYTHCAKVPFDQLRKSGVEIRQSDSFESGGACVWPHRSINELKGMYSARFVKCRSQVDGSTCRECKLCFATRSRNVCVVFDPHGANKGKFQK